MIRNHYGAIFLVLVSVIASLATGPTASGVAAGPAQEVDYEEPSPVNFTVEWRASENTTGDPQSPVAGPVNVQAVARGFPVSLTPVGNLTIVRPGPHLNRKRCPAIGERPGVGNEKLEAETFGIDRNDDELVQNHTDVTFDNIEIFRRFTQEDGLHTGWIDFADEGEPVGAGWGGSSIDIFTEDEVVFELHECLKQSTRQGWYRWYGNVNGSNDGNPDDTGGGDWNTEDWWGDDPDESAAVYSHWYYVCECENRTDAERTLGVPPEYHPYRNASMRAPNYERGVDLTLYSPGSKDRLPGPDPPTTPTPTPTATPTPTPTPTDTSTPSPTPSPTSDSGAPGFTAFATLISLLGALTVLWRLD